MEKLGKPTVPFGYSLSEVFAFSKMTFQALGEEATYVVKALNPHQINFQLLFLNGIVFHKVLMKQNTQQTLEIRHTLTLNCGRN